MVELIAQTGPAAAPPLSPLEILSGVGVLLGAARILFVLDGDLTITQQVLGDPVGFAVQPSATYDEMRADKWKGLRAVVIADKLEWYMRNFRLLLNTRSGYAVCLIFMAQFVLLFVFAGIAAPDTLARQYVLGFAVACIMLWVVMIEKCKSMKKAVELLRVT